ncbi:hypothetical protein DBR28_18720, partial [Chryseobacterium sp. HMWF028]
VILLWYKKEKINTVAFRTLLFSFIYTTVYTSTPFFILILTTMFLGKTVNVQAYLTHLSKLANSGVYESRYFIIFLVFLVFMIVGIVGIFKLFRALHYILKNNFSYHPYVVWFFAVLFFVIQLYYAQGLI